MEERADRNVIRYILQFVVVAGEKTTEMACKSPKHSNTRCDTAGHEFIQSYCVVSPLRWPSVHDLSTHH